MTRVIAQALFLMGVYLLVMTSAKPGDAAAGLLLGLVLALALRPRLPGRRPATPTLIGLVAFGQVLAMGLWPEPLLALSHDAAAVLVKAAA